MKKFRSALVLLLVFSLVISLAGCGKKAIDADDFDDILYEMRFDVFEGSARDRSVREELYAYDDVVYATYQRFRSEDAAKNEYEDMLEELRYDEEDGYFVGDIDESGRGNFRKLVVDGEQEDSWGYVDRIYAVVIYVDDVIIMVGADGNRRSDKEAVDEVVDALGY